MKLHLTFKTPDVLSDAAKEKANDIVEEANQDGNMTDDDAEDFRLETYEKLMAAGRKFVRNDEYVTLEIDVLAGTCKVIT